MPRIFISYRRDDSVDVVGRICEHLVAQLGADALFKDVDSIPYGEDFRRAIAGAISECDVLLAVIGPDWLGAQDGESRLDDPNDYVFSPMIPFDGIRPVYNPEFANADEAGLDDRELVMGVAINGQAKAYPITVLRSREMVNDELGGTPILVTW